MLRPGGGLSRRVAMHPMLAGYVFKVFLIDEWAGGASRDRMH
jgi:hypothetical protein